MRLVAGFTLADQGIIGLRGEPRLGQVIVSVLAAAAGILLTAGLWTPIAGALAAGVELWCTFSPPGDPLTHILLGTLGAAVALVGPGAWSVDARLFGWKRINIRNRNS
jgi:putative oxidoreductase